MQVEKRDGTLEEFDFNKIRTAVHKAFEAVGNTKYDLVIDIIEKSVSAGDEIITIEEIQDLIEDILIETECGNVAKAFIKYREKQKDIRFLKDRIDYMDKYSHGTMNAASSSETDANANVTFKNVANLDGEVFKLKNREIQRYRMKKALSKEFPELVDQYEKDLNEGIIYVHDESSTPTLKAYCMAASLYPLMLNGTGDIDGITPEPPNDIQSFSGQVTNLTFLLSSQVKGAVALGEYLIALNYYVIKEFGELWYEKLDEIITSSSVLKHKTIKDAIRKGMKTFIYGVNQPAGNRSYNSPFTNISYYDKTYFTSLFQDFYYPDGTQPKWEAVDTIQRLFMELHRELRLIKPLTFPVSTLAMVHDGNDIIDKDYKELCAEEYQKGGGFFTYISDSADSLASCCRLRNELSDNTFSPTSGLTGVMTGSCNVITLNINRIIQDCCKRYYGDNYKAESILFDEVLFYSNMMEYLTTILERVYAYHITYKKMLYEMEDRKMFSSSNSGYIYLSKLFSTIGVIGYCEAAEFLGLEVSNNPKYRIFLQSVFNCIRENNTNYSIHNTKYPILFNSEAIPGENLAVKFYNKDAKDGYVVPKDQNLYSSYFFKQWDNSISILDKMKLHGRNTSAFMDGGSACHLNLNEHLSKDQYLRLIDIAISEGTNYFTFNIPMSECKSCGNTVHSPIVECPKCKSTNIDYWTRVIGFLRPLSTYSKERYIESLKRIYTDKNEVC